MKHQTSTEAIPQDIYTFIQLLIEDSKVKIPNQEIKEIMVEEIFLHLNEYISSVIRKNLSEKKTEELNALNKTSKDP
ncbi:MAG: hypothetical protein ABIO02_03335, partial [Patescibacteria group bacterium]